MSDAKRAASIVGARTPSGMSIGGRGIRPDVKAVDDPATRPDEAVAAAAAVLVDKL